jgi:protein CpxP
MTTFTAAKKTLAAAAIALAGVTTGAMAQPRPPAGDSQRADHVRPNRVEGRIAYLKAELKVTPAQEAQWSAVADAMRRSATARQQLWEQTRNKGDQPMTAVDRLNFRERMTQVEADNAKTFATSFAALYTKLDDNQKKQADDLMSPRRHRRL